MNTKPRKLELNRETVRELAQTLPSPERGQGGQAPLLTLTCDIGLCTLTYQPRCF